MIGTLNMPARWVGSKRSQTSLIVNWPLQVSCPFSYPEGTVDVCEVSTQYDILKTTKTMNVRGIMGQIGFGSLMTFRLSPVWVIILFTLINYVTFDMLFYIQIM